MIKKILAIILATITIALFLVISSENEYFEVVFLDVGQGDASLIRFPDGFYVLIDGGPDNLVLNRLGEYLPFNRRNLDLIIVSHWHDDHIVGLMEVLDRYRVGSLMYMAGAEQTDLARSILKKASKKGVKIIPINKEIKISRQTCSLNILSPLSLGVPENGNNSLVTRLECLGLKFLFSGDNELAVEKALLSLNRDWRADVFKASHHGSKTSNSQAFLEAVNPKLIAISVGLDNKFNHPAHEIIEIIKFLGIKIKRTDQDSSIEIRMN